MYLFLDFDGVLRRKSANPSRFEDELRERFESAVRPLPDIRIVISSTWRLALSLRDLRSMFSPDVQGMIVGCTPEITVGTVHQRHDEVLEYFRVNGLEPQQWVAIDDEPDNYPADAPLIVTDPNVGFTSEAALELWKHYAEAVESASKHT